MIFVEDKLVEKAHTNEPESRTPIRSDWNILPALIDSKDKNIVSSVNARDGEEKYD